MSALVGFRLPWSPKSVFENLGHAVVAFSKASWFWARKFTRISPQRGASFFRGQKRVCRDLMKSEVYCRSRCAVFEFSPIVVIFW